MSSILKLHQLDILSFKVLQRLGLWCYLVLNNSSFCSPRHIFFSSATRLFLQFKFERSSWQNTAIFLCESVHILVSSKLKAEQEQVVQTMYRLCADYVQTMYCKTGRYTIWILLFYSLITIGLCTGVLMVMYNVKLYSVLYPPHLAVLLLNLNLISVVHSTFVQVS